MFPVAARNAQIAPFYVMEIVKAAARRQAEGLSVIHMSIGEPDFSAPQSVQEAAIAALSRGATGYSPLGIEPFCVVPGRDFGFSAPERHVRVSCAPSMANLEEAVARMGPFLARRASPKS